MTKVRFHYSKATGCGWSETKSYADTAAADQAAREFAEAAIAEGFTQKDPWFGEPCSSMTTNVSYGARRPGTRDRRVAVVLTDK